MAMTQAEPGYAGKIRRDEKGELVLESVADLHADDWQAWITDRLHRRDKYEEPDIRQGAEPEFLLLTLIRRLGQRAMDRVECAIEDTLHEVTRRIRESDGRGSDARDDWDSAALSSLMYMIRALRLGGCLFAINDLLDRLPPVPGIGASAQDDDPYFQALVTLGELDANSGNDAAISAKRWHELFEKNPDAYIGPCFRAISHFDPVAALRMLHSVNFQAEYVQQTATMELYDFFGRTKKSRDLEDALEELAGDPFKRETIDSALKANASANGWKSNLAAETGLIGIPLEVTEKSLRPQDIAPSQAKNAGASAQRPGVGAQTRTGKRNGAERCHLIGASTP